MDGYGRVIEVTYFDRNGAAVIRAAGYAKLQHRYDTYGRLTEQAIFASDGSPIAISHGFHKWVKRFDERGLLVEQRWFGIPNEPLQVGGQHYTRYAYDERGNTIEIAHFDVHDNTAVGFVPQAEKDCSRWTAKYDTVGKLLARISHRWYGRRPYLVA